MKARLRILVAAATIALAISNVAWAAAVDPSSFVAKLYTEGFGRIRETDPAKTDKLEGFRFWASSYRAARQCDTQLLKEIARAFFTSEEFDLRYSRSTEVRYRVAAMHRAILGREPDQQEFNTDVSQIVNPTGNPAWETLADKLIDTAHFQTWLLPRVCADDGNTPLMSEVGFGIFGPRLFAEPAPNPPKYLKVFGDSTMVKTSAALQCEIDQKAAESGPKIIPLPQGSIVDVTTQIIVHGGVQITTEAPVPDRAQYLKLARFVRTREWVPKWNEPGGAPLCPPYSRPNPMANSFAMIDIVNGSLSRVWVDGGRGVTYSTDNNLRESINVGLYGVGSHVEDSVLNNSPASTTIRAAGKARDGSYPDCPVEPQASQRVMRNLITGYSSRLGEFGGGTGPEVWTDGIQIFCENTLAQDNEIVDLTDAGIVAFGTWHPTTQYPNSRQSSKVLSNLVLNASNSIRFGIAWEPGFVYSAEQPSTLPRSFDGSEFKSNWVEAATNRAVNLMPISAGSAMLWQLPRKSSDIPTPCNKQFIYGAGGSDPTKWPLVEGNVVRGSAKVAYSVYGMKNVRFQNNELTSPAYWNYWLGIASECPRQTRGNKASPCVVANPTRA